MKTCLAICLYLSATLSLYAANFPSVTQNDQLRICEYLLEENYQEDASTKDFMINYCLEHGQFSYLQYPTAEERIVQANVWFAPYYTHRCEIEMSFDQVGMADCQ